MFQKKKKLKSLTWMSLINLYNFNNINKKNTIIIKKLKKHQQRIKCKKNDSSPSRIACPICDLVVISG
jgi:hypothetical protein